MFGDGPRSLLRRFFLQMVELCRLIGARRRILEGPRPDNKRD